MVTFRDDHCHAWLSSELSEIESIWPHVGHFPLNINSLSASRALNVREISFRLTKWPQWTHAAPTEAGGLKTWRLWANTSKKSSLNPINPANTPFIIQPGV
jgi:hypothetical protein